MFQLPQQGQALGIQAAHSGGAFQHAAGLLAATGLQQVPGRQHVQALGPAPVQGGEQVVIQVGEDRTGPGLFHDQPAGQMRVVLLPFQIAKQQEQAMPQHMQDALQLARGALGGLLAQLAQRIVELGRHALMASQLGQTVGIVLALEGVLAQFGALVEGIAHAPVDERLHRLLADQAVGMTAAGILPEQDGVLVRGLGLAVAEQVMRRVLEAPEHALAHGLAQEVADGRIGNGAFVIDTAALLFQPLIDLAVVTHQVAH